MLRRIVYVVVLVDRVAAIAFKGVHEAEPVADLMGGDVAYHARLGSDGVDYTGGWLVGNLEPNTDDYLAVGYGGSQEQAYI
jgi:hypothetical protein